MTRSLTRMLSIVGLAAGLSLVAAPSANADSAADFGQHVRTCVQVTGFDGAMNPGMHEGRSEWDPGHEC